MTRPARAAAAQRRPRRRLLRTLALGALALLVLAAASLAVWIAVAGRDFVWSKIRPDHARLLALQDDPAIPDELPAAAWSDDLDHLAKELPRRYRRFQPGGAAGAAEPAFDRTAFDAELAELRARLPDLSREEIELGLMRIAALPGAGTGHTGIQPFQRPLDWRMYPLYAWRFDDGVWVTLAGAGAEAALGRRIVAVGGVPVDEIVERAAPALAADNESGRRALHGAVFSFAEMLQAVGAVGPDGVAHLTLESDDGEVSELAVEPAPLASIAGLRWGRVIQSPIAGDPFALASPADPRPRERSFDFAYRPEDRLLFLRIDRIDDDGDDTFAGLVERLRAVADEHPVERFVIDLRANGGGNNQLAGPLVDFLSGHPEIDRRGVLYTLIGSRTYSAAGNLAAALERRTKTLFAGEPTGSTPNHWGDAIDLPLPRSKIFFRVSTRFWQDGGPWDRRPAIAPSPGLAVATTHDDHFAGRDSVLEAVLAHRPEPVAELALEPAAARELADRLSGSYRFGDYRRMVVAAGEDDRLRMSVDGVGRWAESDLYPVARDGETVRFATDLEGVFLELGGGGEATIDWHGARHPLPRVADDYRTPIERLRGAEPESPPTDAEIADGVAAFRAIAGSGAAVEVPDSWTELELNRIGYALLAADRPAAAVELFRLQAELFPEAANSFDSLGDGYRAAGDRERAERAYRRALALDPDFGHARRMLAEMAAEAP